METTGFIGCGAMGSALIRGIVNSGAASPEAVIVYDRMADRAAALGRELGVQVAGGVEDLCRQITYLFLAVKPQDFPTLLPELDAHLTADKVVISLAAGISCRYIANRLHRARLLRIMPNTPCLVGEGLIALSAGPRATGEDLHRVQTLLEATGRVLILDEKHLNAVTALSGSGPAFIFLVIEALADGGVEAGLPRELAVQIAAQTAAGAARMVVATGRHPAQLKNDVTSPAGTTSAGLQALEKHGLRWALISAVGDAAQKAAELEC